MSITDVVVPDIGDSGEVSVIEILVERGQGVEPGDGLIVLESDKATMEVPAPIGGSIVTISVAVGDKVRSGSPILQMATEEVPLSKMEADPGPQSNAGIAASLPAVAGPSSTPAWSSVPPLPDRRAAHGAESAERRPSLVHASPSVRAYARELGVDLSEVSGSGPKARILREDVRQFVKSKVRSNGNTGAGVGLELIPWPEVDFERFGPVERVELSRVQRISGPSLSRNWVTIPHVTNFDEADITDLEEFRRQVNAGPAGANGQKTTILAFLIRACAATLRAFPEFNSSLQKEHLILKKYINIGFAADTPNGLVVPVVREADNKGVLQIAAELADLASRARDGKLKATEMQGGTFSISSLGGIGGTGFTPIINAPEVSILGVAKARTQAVWDGSQFQPRLMLPLCLSWDHRALDGAAAARFLAHLAGLLADFRRILL